MSLVKIRANENMDMRTGRGLGKVGTETGAMCLQGRNDQGLPAATRSQERGTEQILPQWLQKEAALRTP